MYWLSFARLWFQTSFKLAHFFFVWDISRDIREKCNKSLALNLIFSRLRKISEMGEETRKKIYQSEKWNLMKRARERDRGPSESPGVTLVEKGNGNDFFPSLLSTRITTTIRMNTCLKGIVEFQHFFCPHLFFSFLPKKMSSHQLDQPVVESPRGDQQSDRIIFLNKFISS